MLSGVEKQIVLVLVGGIGVARGFRGPGTAHGAGRGLGKVLVFVVLV